MHVGIQPGSPDGRLVGNIVLDSNTGPFVNSPHFGNSTFWPTSIYGRLLERPQHMDSKVLDRVHPGPKILDLRDRRALLGSIRVAYFCGWGAML